MKYLALAALVMSMHSSVFAKMNWSFEGRAVCADSFESNLSAVNDIFCESTKDFSKNEFCQEVECLLVKHPSHCNEVVYETINRLNISFMQDSRSFFELDNAITKYCEKDSF